MASRRLPGCVFHVIGSVFIALGVLLWAFGSLNVSSSGRSRKIASKGVDLAGLGVIAFGALFFWRASRNRRLDEQEEEIRQVELRREKEAQEAKLREGLKEELRQEMQGMLTAEKDKKDLQEPPT